MYTGDDIGQLSGVSLCFLNAQDCNCDTSPGGASSTNEEAICVDDMICLVVFMQLRLSSTRPPHDA